MSISLEAMTRFNQLIKKKNVSCFISAVWGRRRDPRRASRNSRYPRGKRQFLFPSKIWLITPFPRCDDMLHDSIVFLSGQHRPRLPDATERDLFLFFSANLFFPKAFVFRGAHGINPDGGIIKHNEADHLGGARCSGGIKTSSTARDRSIDYTPGKVRDPRSGWQAMCTDPSRSSKQYHATACASMHANGARANRSANHPRNARFSLLILIVASPSRVESVSNQPRHFWPLSHFCLYITAAPKERLRNSHFDNKHYFEVRGPSHFASQQKW